jgi:hypothetical protein
LTELQIRFGNGREVLNAYWGYLSDGGLVVLDHGVDVGQTVALEVHVESTRTRYALVGTVVRREAGGSMVIRFNPGEPHDMLLTEALAETDNVPARRHRRYRLERPGRIAADAPIAGACRILDVSEEGCCVEVTAETAALEVGTRLTVMWDGIKVVGKVVWSRHTERGVAFDLGSRGPELLACVRRLADEARHAPEPERAEA